MIREVIIGINERSPSAALINKTIEKVKKLYKMGDWDGNYVLSDTSLMVTFGENGGKVVTLLFAKGFDWQWSVDMGVYVDTLPHHPNDQSQALHDSQVNYSDAFNKGYNANNVLDSGVSKLLRQIFKLPKEKPEKGVWENLDESSDDTFIDAIAELTGLRKGAVSKWVSDNDIDSYELMQSIGQKKTNFMDMTTAIVGKPNNIYHKKLVKQFGR